MIAKRLVPALLACGLLALFGAAGVVIADDAPFVPVIVAEHGFESGNTHGWVPRGGAGVVAATTEAAHTGSGCLKMSERKLDWHMARVELTSMLEKGARYEIELYVRLAPGVKPNPINLTILTRSASDAEDTLSGDVMATDTAWTKLRGQWEFDAGAASAYLYLYLHDAPSFTGAYYVDDLKVTKIAPALKAGEPIKLMNYDFEGGKTQGWAPRGAGVQIASVTEAAHAGSCSLKTTNRTANWHGASLNVKDLLKKGAVYNFTGYMRLVQAPGSPSIVKFTMEQKLAGAATNWKTVAQAEIADTEWVKLTGDYTYTGEMEALVFYAESSNKDEVFYLDDVAVTMIAPPPTPSIEKNLRALKDAVPFHIGAAIEPDQLLGLQGEMLNKHFNCLVAENVMKPGPIHPKEDVYVWGPADQIVQFATANKMEMRYHTLVWHSQVADWFFMDAAGKDMALETDPAKRAANKRLLLKRLEDHITAIVGRYKDRIKSWDVVNEVIDPNEPNGLRISKWYQITGTDYIETAFRTARKVGGPKIKLYITDYNTESPAKRDFLFRLIREMLARGVPIDGVGHQAHVNLEQPSVAALSESIKLFAGIGLDNQITELDVSVYLNDSTAYRTVPKELLELQGYRYKELFASFRQLKANISNVTLWGFVDSHTWLHNRPIPRRDAPFPFDELYHAKPAYWGIVDPGHLPIINQKLQTPKGAPKVDGIEDACWQMFSPFPLEQGEGLSATFKTLWNDKYLYVMVDVKDDTVNEEDAVEVYIDGDNKKTEIYGADDLHFTLTRDGKASGGASVAVKNYKGGYLLEASIPLRNAAAIGQQVGFDVRVTDADQIYAVVSWNDLTHGQDVNTAKYGTITFGTALNAAEAVKGTPMIDGVVDPAWSKAGIIQTGVFVKGAKVATAKARMMWDEKYLYVLIEVADPLLNKANANVWEQDSVEIFIDENNAKTTVYEADDAQYRVNFDNLQSFGSNGQDARFKSAAKKVDGGYLVEAAVPFKTIKSRSGLMIGFDIQVNDADVNGQRQGVVTWNDPIGNNYRDTTYFGNLILEVV